MSSPSFYLIFGVAELLTTNKLSELACLALYLMYEKKQGKKSFWYPFIKELDRQRGRGQLAVESPLLWSESELAYLDGSPTRVIYIFFIIIIIFAYNDALSLIYCLSTLSLSQHINSCLIDLIILLVFDCCKFITM